MPLTTVVEGVFRRSTLACAGRQSLSPCTQQHALKPAMTRRGVGFATHAHVPPTLPNPLLMGHVIHSSKVPSKQPKHNAHVMGEHNTHGGTTSSAMLSKGEGAYVTASQPLVAGKPSWQQVYSAGKSTHTHPHSVSKAASCVL